MAKHERGRRRLPWKTVLGLLVLATATPEAAPRLHDGFDVRAHVLELVGLDLLLPSDWAFHFDTFIQEKKREFEVRPLERNELNPWLTMIGHALLDMGLDDGQPIPAQLREMQPGSLRASLLPNQGYVMFPEMNTISLDSKVLENRAKALQLIAHESAHQKAEHIFLRQVVFENFSQPGLPLWLPEYAESQAQLLGAEALARLVYEAPESEQRVQAREGILSLLKNIVTEARAFDRFRVGISKDLIPGSKPSQGYYYGYIPLTQIYQLMSTGHLELPVVEHGPLGVVNTLQYIEFPWLYRFLQDEGLGSLVG